MQHMQTVIITKVGDAGTNLFVNKICFSRPLSVCRENKHEPRSKLVLNEMIYEKKIVC
jgi:hypothetical protein